MEVDEQARANLLDQLEDIESKPRPEDALASTGDLGGCRPTRSHRGSFLVDPES